MLSGKIDDMHEGTGDRSDPQPGLAQIIPRRIADFE